MEAVKVISGPVTALKRADVDTDQIIPKQFLKRIERTGFGEFLFYDWAQEPGWSLPKNPILATGRELRLRLAAASTRRGRCRTTASRRSSRPRFADIFFSNCTKIGLLPVVLPEEEVRALMEAGEAEVDLEALEVRFAGRAVPFELDEERRHRLLNGLDDIDLTLQKADEIAAYEARARASRPGHPESVGSPNLCPISPSCPATGSAPKWPPPPSRSSTPSPTTSPSTSTPPAAPPSTPTASP